MSQDSPVVVITGASSGIGRATALRFADSRARIVAGARGEDALEALVRQCEQLGAQAVAVPTEVTDPASVEALAQTALDLFGRIDVWVNAAAVNVFGLIEEIPLDEFRRVLDVGVLGYVHGMRAVLPVFKSQGHGVVVNVASLTAPIPQPYTAPYSMAKAAVRALGVSARSELALGGHSKVHVCTVLPAAIDTPFFQHAGNHTGRAVRALPPVYTPERVARAIVGVTRFPRREVAVGTIGRLMALQHRITPGIVEGLMALQVQHTHLSPAHSATDTTGNLFTPSDPGRWGQVHGDWHGARKTFVRRAALVGAAAVGTAVVALSRRR